MRTIHVGVLVGLTLALGLGMGPRASRAQDPVKKEKDEALEKLLEKLDDPKPGPKGPTDPAQKPVPKPIEPGSASKDDALDKLLDNLDAPKPGAVGKPDAKKPGELDSKDQSLDKLLEGLGGISDKPAPEEKKASGNGPPPGSPPPPAPGDGDAKASPLDDAERKLDELLEEKTGRKPRSKPKQGQSRGQGQGQGEDGADGGGGPLGDLIKQMREVENRLDKPDTGAETRRKQTEIVKNLDTLLEQMRNSSSQSQAMKMMRGGQKPGGPPQPGQGNQPGATGQGVGLAKPTPPRTPPAAVELVKEVWGQLPDQFRDDMANVLNEKALPAKAEMIRLYYLSLGKKSATKGD